MTSNRRNCITPREGMSEEQVTLLSFRERFFYLFGRHKSHLMWLRKVDGGCLSYGAPALPAHLHLLPAPFFRFCAGDIDEYMDMDIFLDTEEVIQAGIAIFQYIYHGPDTTLGEICYMFSRKVVAGVIKPETLPPTKGAAAQHALRAYT